MKIPHFSFSIPHFSSLPLGGVDGGLHFSLVIALFLMLCTTASAQSLSEQAAAKDREIAELKRQLAEKQARMRLLETANLSPAIAFEKNSALVEDSQLDALEMIAKYIKSQKTALVEVRTFASIDESNTQKLCEDRANNVMTKLITKYKVKPSQLKAAVYGKTDKLYSSPEQNRIVTFNDLSRQ